MRKSILLAILSLIAIFSASAVTPQEMEQARAISAKTYLRWSNNGSDYLDNIKPTTLSDLETKLRDREKENLRAFKAIPLPAGYEQWDKAKLVEYWSQTALNAAGLNKDGVRAGCKAQIKSQINNMSVSAPAPAQPSEEEIAARQQQIKDSIEAARQEEPQEEAILSEEEIVSDSTEAVGDSIETPAQKSSSSSSWIYIVALALLVVAVVVLVVYASRSMNRSNPPSETRQRADDHRPHVVVEPQPHRAAATVTRADEGSEPDDIRTLREKYADTLARRQDEIRALNRRVTDLENENVRLEEEKLHLQEECENLRREAQNMPADPVAPAAPATATRNTQPTGRNIYLGRVNANGVFVRADRNLNPGNSIYVLQTTDGFSGTFRVAADRSVYDTAFARPQEMLAGGCVAMDITDTHGRHSIVTESAGTAIFENNCWRVIRKAKIRYE